MCGIVAIYSYHNDAPPVDRDELRKIRDYMRLRGPDGKGEWYTENMRVGLGHRRLAIIDLSDNAAQPMTSEDGKLVISFNGEIYNYQALRQDLKKKGYQFRTHSDTEVLLHLYIEKGESMVHDLRGMFVFVIWDERKQGMFLVRDHFGIKPLYYADNDKMLRVASQVKALLAGGQIKQDLEPAGQVGFFLWGHLPEPYTMYRSIHALPAGTSLWIDQQGNKRFTKFFSISKEIQQTFSSMQESHWQQDDLREALIDSVQHHLVADVPVGFFLSSGLDSTALTALATEMISDLHTVTLGFREYQGTEKDEVPLAESVAHHYGTNHQTEWIKKEEFAEELPHLLKAMDQPTIDGVNSYFVSKVTAATGLKVAVSGIGGDELFGGYPSFRQIPKIVRQLRPLARLSPVGKLARLVSAPLVKRMTSPKYAGVFEYGGTYGGAYFLRRSLFMPWELPQLLEKETCKEGLEKLQTMNRLQETTANIKNDHLKVSALELEWYMRNQLLRDADWASMAHSLEIRVPLVDINLFRTVISAIASHHSLNKKDMALTPKRSLPREIFHKEKTGFSIPVQDWLLGSDKEGRYNAARGLRGWSQKVYLAVVEKDLT